MKKFYLLTKTLLVMALLCVGASNALAEVTPFSESYSSTSTTSGWKTGTGGRFTPAILNESDNYFLSVDQDTRYNNGATVTGSIISGKAAAGDDFTLIFDLRLVSSNNQTPVSISFQDAANTGTVFSLTATGKNVTTWTINGTDTQVTLPNSSGNPAIANVPWITCKISRSGNLTYVTITNKSTSDVIFARATVGGASATGGLGNIVFVSRRYNANFAIDNIVVREIEDGDVPQVVPTTYTIKYRNESDEEIADDIVTDSYVGAENIEATALQISAKMYNEKKYIYKSGNTPITLVENAASNVITLVYREAAIYSYAVNATYNSNIIETIKSGNAFEGDAVSFVNKHFYNVDGNLVKFAATSHSYSASFTPEKDEDVTSVNYADAGKGDVVFFAEAEDIATLTPLTSSYLPDRFSGGMGGYAKDENQIITTLPSGKYKLTAHIMGTMSECTFTFKAGDKTIWENTTNSGSFYDGDGITGSEFTLDGSTDIILVAAGGDGSSTRVTNLVDFIYIQKILESVPATITSAGYATFSSKYALDFTDAAVEAYIATGGDETTVTMQKVAGTVAANTGLVLKGAKGSYNIPIVAEGTDYSGTNKLWAITSAATVKKADDGYTNYVLANQGGKVVFASVTDENSASLPAGSAALCLQNPNSARAISLVFGGITGVEAVEAASEAAQKEGKFVINGQLVIKKNGKMFNAAGAQMK